MGRLLRDSESPLSKSGEAGGQRSDTFSGILAPRAYSARANGFGEGKSPRCRGKFFCRNRRKAWAEEKTSSVTRKGRRPFESMTSSLTGSFLAAAATIRRRKKQGKS